MMILSFSTTRLGPNIKVMLLPFSFFCILVVLTLVLINEGVAKINTQNQDITRTTSSVNVLRGKVSMLKTLDVTALSNTDAVVLAHPSSNPSTIFVSQIRQIATEEALTIDKIEMTATAGKDNIESTDLKMIVGGEDVNALLKLANEIDRVAPVVTLTDVLIKKENANVQTTYSLEFTAKLHWSPLPTTLSRLTEPVKALSASEVSTLRWVEGLKKPQLDNIEVSNPEKRENPFR